MSAAPLVSVVVPARACSEGDLRSLLAGLRAQTLARERFEVIVVDDGSQPPLSHPLPADGDWLTVARIAVRNSYAARNHGAGLARGRVLAFTDSDCTPRAGWLSGGLRELAHADLVAGHIELRLAERPSVWSILDAMTFDQRRFVELGKAATANLFIGAELFARHGGFDSSLASGGDWELVERCLRAGARLSYSPVAVVEHGTRSGPASFLRRRWRIERAMGARCRRARRSLLVFNTAREPVVKRRFGFAVGYDPERLVALGIADGWRTRLATVPARYLIVPAVEALAQASGFLLGRGSD
jgi:glycosyltransferase involved in cell wall biosynthesis